MARHKPVAKKFRLAHAAKRRRSVPTWIVARTRGRVRRSARKRTWRMQRIKA